jgi:hypothetical protein
MNHIDNKLFYINSKKRLSGTTSNFTYEIDTNEYIPDRVAVMSLNIAKTYYMVQSPYNTMTLTENGVDTTLTFTPGNYSRKSLKSIFQNLLNDNSSQGWSYIVSYPSSSAVDTGKYTFSVTGNSGLQPSFTFSNGQIHEMLGFAENSTNTFTADSLTSVNVIKIQKEDSLFIRSDIVGQHSVQILQEVYTHQTADYDHVFFINNDPHMTSKKINNHHSNIYTFQLTNEDGQEVDLNGGEWTMTLALYTVDKTNEEINKYIKSKHAINKNSYIF